MGIKQYKPTTSTLRFTALPTFEEITTTEPFKPLLKPVKQKGGRNSRGRMTVRRRGGGHKRRYRIIDFKRDKDNIPARVVSIEYDPNRSARIALLLYRDGEYRYILAPTGLEVNRKVISGEDAEIEVGNALALKNIPIGIPIHNVELMAAQGGKLVRGAGSCASIMAKEGKYAHVKLPSGEIRLISLECRATIGQVSNVEHEALSLGKAGRSRWLGRRPRVRGVAMNPVDHPMGGGEGKSAGGRHPCSPQGQLAKGLKTRRKKKPSWYIITDRRAKK